MQLPSSLGELDFGNWIYGLGAAFIGGGASAFSAGISTILVDPHDFTIYTAKFWAVVSTTFVVSGFLSMMAYLHTKPLPDIKTTTTTSKKTSVVDNPPALIEETKVEVKTEAINIGKDK